MRVTDGGDRTTSNGLPALIGRRGSNHVIDRIGQDLLLQLIMTVELAKVIAEIEASDENGP